MTEKENSKKGNVLKLKKRKDNSNSKNNKEEESDKTIKNNNSKLKISCLKKSKPNNKILTGFKKPEKKK